MLSGITSAAECAALQVTKAAGNSPRAMKHAVWCLTRPSLKGGLSCMATDVLTAVIQQVSGRACLQGVGRQAGG